MIGAIKSMNNLFGWYLGLNLDGDVAYEYDCEITGKTELYIDKLEFDDDDDFDLNEEWDKFCDKFFNDDTYNFYKSVDDWSDFADEFNSREMIWLINETNKFWIELTGEPLPHECFAEERLWNNIAYCWIREHSENIKSFVMKKIQEKFDEWKDELKTEKENYRLSCDICFTHKQIHSYSACCVDKKFCRTCFKKLKDKPCPYCRGKITHKIYVDDERGCQCSYFDWYNLMRKSLYIIKDSQEKFSKKDS